MSIPTAMRLPRHKLVAWVMLFLWAIYTIVYTLAFDKNLGAILEALAGSLGIVFLLAMGVARKELYI